MAPNFSKIALKNNSVLAILDLRDDYPKWERIENLSAYSGNSVFIIDDCKEVQLLEGVNQNFALLGKAYFGKNMYYLLYDLSCDCLSLAGHNSQTQHGSFYNRIKCKYDSQKRIKDPILLWSIDRKRVYTLKLPLYISSTGHDGMKTVKDYYRSFGLENKSSDLSRTIEKKKKNTSRYGSIE